MRVGIWLHRTFDHPIKKLLELSINFMLYCITVILFILFIQSLTPAALVSTSTLPQIPRGKNALILVSPGYGVPGVDLYVSTLLKKLNSSGFLLNDIHVEFLDLNRRSEKADRQRLVTTLQDKYGGTEIDLLFCIMEPALNFFLNEIEELAPQAPVLCSFAVIPAGFNPGTRRFVFQTSSWDFSGTMQLALRLFPHTEHVFVIQGNSEIELANRDIKRRQLAPWQGKLQIEDTQALSADEIEAKFASASKDTIIIGAGLIRDSKGQVFVPDEFMRRIAKTANAPIFVLTNNNIGYGTIGGSVSRFEEEALALSTMGVDILSGSIQLTEQITSISGIKVPIFDWQQLERWGANIKDLPPNTIFKNRPLTLWGQYKIEVIIWTVLSFGLVVFILLMALMNRRQKLTNIELEESRKQYLNLVESTPDLIARVDKTGRILFVNHSALEIFGIPVEECIGRLIFDFIHPQDLPATRDAFQGAFEGDGNTFTLENRLVSNHDLAHYMTWVIRAEYDENGQISGLASTARNITERKRVEENLRESEEEFRNLFENTPVSSWLEDFSGVKKHFDALREEGISDIETYFREHPEGLERCVQGIKIKDVNQATLELHQAKNKEQLLQDLDATFTPESLVVFKKEMVDVWNGKTQATYDSVVRTFGDEVRYVTVSYKVAPGHEESLAKVLVTLVDITEKTLADTQKSKLEMQLRQAQKMESIGTLAGGIAHDFNNILASILGYAEMAREDCLPGSTIHNDLNEVLEAGNRAKGLVRQILAFSRQDDMERIILQPASIVKETITMLRPSLPTTIEITQDIDAATGLVFVDPTQLNQILMNLCTNAFHAMEDTGGKLDISLKEVTLSNEDLVHEPDVTAGTFIQLSIGDSGKGIAPAIKDKIFDPFFTTKETGKGTGMGLAMVYGIVKQYGGFISLYSELGEGTVFHVFLPTTEKEALTENETNDPIPIGRERVLFVDDEEILSKMGKTMLERLGYHVTVRNSSFEALETFQNQPDEFDIVITDQTMPGMTGSDMSRRMLQIRPDIPIILCTGYSTIISEEKAKSMGIKEFALKPLAKKDMAKLMRKVLDV